MKSRNTRREFLRNAAKFGLLLPLANQLLGTKALAAGGGAQRVLFVYYPNGVDPSVWNPSNEGAFNKNNASFCLEPLAEKYASRVNVLKNMYLSGTPGGAHEGIKTCLAGVADDNATSVDHIIAERLKSPVTYLGVRTSLDSNKFCSKPANTGRKEPLCDPKPAAELLFRGVNTDGNSGGNTNSGNENTDREILETVLDDFAALRANSLSQSAKTKVDLHAKTLEDLRDRIGVVVSNGACRVRLTDVSDPFNASSTGDKSTKYNLIPQIARAQIENAVGALSCGVSRVATLQLFAPNNHPDFALFAFDECFDLMQMATSRGKALGVGDIAKSRADWWGEYESHRSSHDQNGIYAGIHRWYATLLVYLLEQMEQQSILDTTLVVFMSECGHSNAHGQAKAGIIVAGGAGGNMTMGRVIDGQAMQNDEPFNAKHRTTQLFVDIGKAMGLDLSSANGWGSGGVIL